MTMGNDYDAEFEQANLMSGGGELRWMSVLVIVLGIFGFFSLVWYAYNTSMVGQTDDRSVPVIEASSQTYKTKPHDIGGLDIANKDIESYQLMRREPSVAEEARKVERLMPKADKPITIETVKSSVAIQGSVPQVKEHVDIDNAEASIVGTTLKQSDEQKLDVLIQQAGNAGTTSAERAQEITVLASPKIKKITEKLEPVETIELTPTESSVTPEVVVPKVEKIVAPKPTAAPKPKAVKAAPVSSSTPYVQLAALRSEAEAKRLWAKLSAKHSDVLGGLSYYTEAVQIAGKGTLYRLRASGVSSHAKAKSICKTLKGRKQGCLASR